jgi:hypothetical protein
VKRRSVLRLRRDAADDPDRRQLDRVAARVRRRARGLLRDGRLQRDERWLGSTFDGTCRLWIHDLATNLRTPLTEAVRVGGSPCVAQTWRARAVALSGRRLVVEGAPGSLDSTLALVDVADGTRRAITTYRDAHATLPSLDGDRLVWQDDRGGDFELYFMDLTDAERGDLSPEGVTP